MTLYAYLALDLPARADYLWEKGELITMLPERSNFYALDDFFVEVVVDRSTHTIHEITPFLIGERYERMIAYVDLTELI